MKMKTKMKMRKKAKLQQTPVDCCLLSAACCLLPVACCCLLLVQRNLNCTCRCRYKLKLCCKHNAQTHTHTLTHSYSYTCTHAQQTPTLSRLHSVLRFTAKTKTSSTSCPSLLPSAQPKGSNHIATCMPYKKCITINSRNFLFTNRAFYVIYVIILYIIL